MKKLFLKAVLFAVGLNCAGVVNAAILLTVDLNTTNEITITATNGLSDADAEGIPGAGFYLDGFFNTAPTSNLGDILVSGDLTSAANTSNGVPQLYNTGVPDLGLNVFGFSDDATATFTTGNVAFSGSATWTIDSAVYEKALAGPVSGNIYFPVEDSDQIGDEGVELLGQWRNTTVAPIQATPVPSLSAYGLVLTMLGLLMVAGRILRKQNQ